MANSTFKDLAIESVVVNCFQISNFVLWQTATTLIDNYIKALWIAFKLVILSYGKQHRQVGKVLRSVVNCFQISNFVLWQTAGFQFVKKVVELWIAFKLVILSYGKQQIRYNHETIWVVNCFQISNFVLWQTAGPVSITG